MFSSLSLVKPGWWMLLAPTGLPSAFVDVDKLSSEEREILDIDAGYQGKTASKWDAAYIAFFRGIVATSETALCNEGEATADDEYRFLRRFFSRWWSYYCFVARCLQMHNPVNELRALLRARKIARVDLWSRMVSPVCPEVEKRNKIDYRKVTVVIPTLNRYEYLREALEDLEKQTHESFEVIVIDQSEPYREEFYQEFKLPIRVKRQDRPGLWKARNSAVRESMGEFVLLFDDDSRVDPDWIAKHLECIDAYDADISSGVSLSVVGDRVPESYRNYRQADQLDTGNALVKKSVFEKVGMFDEQFEGQRMGDAEFGLRAFQSGFRLVSNPDAKRVHLKVGTGGLRQMGSWDAFRPKSLFAPRPVPSVLYLLRKYFGARSAVRAVCLLVPPSVVPYKLKGNRFLQACGYVSAIFLAPLLFVQVCRSWKRAGQMLSEGAKIPMLEA